MLPENKETWEWSEEEEPSRTFRIQDGRIVGETDGTEAVRQAVAAILNTERYEYPIYSWDYGMEYQDLFGRPGVYVKAELKRRITDALTQDDRIRSVDSFTFTERGRKLLVSFVVHTEFGELETEQEVEY